MKIPDRWDMDYVAQQTVYPGRVPSTGNASTLPMTEDEIKAAAKRKRPIGFVVDEPKPARARRKKAKP